MNNDSRVFITGLGALTACGNSVQDTWQAICAGRHGIGEITQWDLSSWQYRLGGELKNFQPAKLLPDRKLMKVISRQDAMGIITAIQAVNDSGIIDFRLTLSTPAAHANFNEQTAIYVGSPGNKYMQQYDFLPLVASSQGNMRAFANNLFDIVHPMWLLRILPNNVLAYTGITYGFKGVNHNFTNHAVGGTQALIEAYQAIKTGQAQRAVVVAYDVGIEPQALFYYEKLGIISPRHLKPFDQEHDGTILAEGAAAVVLESEESMVQRAGKPYAEIAGGMTASECSGLFSIAADGGALAALLTRTLDNLVILPQEIDLVVTHGNGNSKSDLSEAAAIAAVFKMQPVPVTAFKWAMGHTITAAGILDLIFTVLALRNYCVPGIVNLQNAAAGCDYLNISAKNRVLASNNMAILINRGFASMNACLVIKSCN